MLSKNTLAHLRRLVGSYMSSFSNATPHPKVDSACSRRTFATVHDAPREANGSSRSNSNRSFQDDFVTTTVHDFPSFEPLRFAQYPKTHLSVPLRRDILWRAVVYEGDKTRLGTASTKWRNELPGSFRKLMPQKGTGRARVGDKNSPIRQGGGVAHGPKPRDFSTRLQRKIYDLAWRMALSYRFRRGELLIVDKFKNLPSTQDWWVDQLFKTNKLGRYNHRSLLVATDKTQREELFEGVKANPKHGELIAQSDLDVKDLLEKGTVILEQSVLHYIFKRHTSDLPRPKLGYASNLPPVLTTEQLEAIELAATAEVEAEIEAEAELEAVGGAPAQGLEDAAIGNLIGAEARANASKD